MAGLTLNPYDINYGSFMGAPAGGAGASNPTGAYLQGGTSMQTGGVGSTLATPTSMAAPTTMGAPGGMGTGLGMNMGTGQLALGAIGTIGNLWMAWNAQKMAQKQFEYQKGITDTNLTNSIKSYNTSLIDRITSRAAMQGEDQSYINDYLDDNRLRDERKKK